ncbi:hypothetical protein SDC9_210592 [bioreactor metagenome]|uniref:Uncharacterized protein n=1 Tax=bioreactor metagenome TaxID=1076179 RepID=A0A645JJF6_9ZZZZ
MNILFDKLRSKLIIHAQQILHHQNLCITSRAGTYADSGYGHLFCDQLGNRSNNTFQYNRKRPGLFKMECILNQFARNFSLFPLNFETA